MYLPEKVSIVKIRVRVKVWVRVRVRVRVRVGVRVRGRSMVRVKVRFRFRFLFSFFLHFILVYNKESFVLMYLQILEIRIDFIIMFSTGALLS